MEVPANTSISVSCKANLGIVDQRMPMTFTPDADCLHERISIPDSVVEVKTCAANKIIVLVVNETSLYIQFSSIRMQILEMWKYSSQLHHRNHCM